MGYHASVCAGNLHNSIPREKKKREREKGSRRPLVYLDSTSKVGGKMVACCILEKLYCLS